MKEPFPAEFLQNLLRYDAESGRLYWEHRPREMFPTQRSYATWNARFADVEAFTAINNCGYRFGTILGHVMLAHRIIYALIHKAWPDLDIDHINGVRLDNRIQNLRLVDRATNTRNRAKLVSSKRPALGVYQKGSRWIASMTLNYRKIHLGSFATVEEAIARRKTADLENGFHINHGRKAQ